MGETPERRLEAYRAKRRPGATPEPFGGGPSRPRLYCVQKHAATRLHYDLRLEWRGVLLSWAVPKGPSLDPDVKRLAMQTEDHPVEYADFEGVIPEGNYGAGEVIVWDLGSWVPLEDPDAGLDKGKLLFELKGHKLRGVWTLFRTKREGAEGREWLLVKKPDAYAAAGEPAWPETSVLSGRTVDELREGTTRAAEVRAELERLSVPRRAVDAARLEPMLARTAPKPFSSPDWIYELKHDGFRLLCALDGGRAFLRYRSGRDATRVFPEIARAVRSLPYPSLILDGEVCVHDDEGKPDFQRLQRRVQLLRDADIERAAVELPAVCWVFDLVAFDGFDLRRLPLLERKRLLRRVLPEAGVLRYSDHIEARGEAFFERVREMGLEGVLAKRAASGYASGRSDDWLKVRADLRDDFVVVGYTAPKGSRAGLGALHLAAYDGGELVYAGRVGTGLPDELLESLRAQLDAARRDAPPCSGPVPRTRGHTWSEPRLVCEVRYKERTADGLLRQPAFQRVRDDKPPRECLMPAARGGDPPDPAPSPPLRAESRGFTPTNTDKVFWPDDGYTKGDLIEYYRRIGPWILPYLRDRPVVLTRYPDGITGKSFFQKDAPSWAPGWLRTERIRSEQAERDIDYFVCESAEAVAFLANLGTIPLHVWASRVPAIDRPDWCILDLDPKGADFAHVVAVALAIRELCEDVGMPSYVKTSGSTGLHVLLPLGAQVDYAQCRTLGELIARVVERAHPDLATTERVIQARKGRVYVDFLQNGHGKLIAAPFSVRPRPGAPVSTPLRWSEVDGKLRIEAHTIATVPARMESGGDPMLPVLTDRPDLLSILQRLADRV